MSKKISSTRPKVNKLLTEHQELRDSDQLLCIRFWNAEITELGYAIQQMDYVSFCVLYTNGKLTPADIITRARRAVQQEFPHTRGERYEKRHNAQEDVKSDLRVKEIPTAEHSI